MSYQENRTTHIHWFRDDLRLEDQPFSFLENYTHFFGVYIVDPKLVKRTAFGFRKTGLHRIIHLREALCELQQELRKKNSDLLVLWGEPHRVLQELCTSFKADISFQKAYGTEEIESEILVQNTLSDCGVRSWEGNFLIHPNDMVLNAHQFPKSFSGFRKKAEKIAKTLQYKTFPKLNKLPPTPKEFRKIKASKAKTHPSSAVPFQGGCSSGLKRLQTYFFESGNVAKYKETRNQLIGESYSSKLSIYLANGALSPIQVMKELQRFENDVVKNKSTYWLFFELLWRDFFRHALRFYGRKMFLKNGLENNEQVFKNTDQAFLAWKNGTTPSSFVNANMKELKLSGYMSNRGRQNVASFLVHDLGVDWRKGAAWFEHCLKDYDVASNQGNWMYITGVGFNPKGKSYFDLNFQVNRYDPNLTYTQLWTKEQL